ncbi:ribosomal-protein-alanine N-acetyltransferase RimI [Candidatus Bathyarchaeota archaeon]|nr:ribosomal-protein-alanine N-acetyltransferase RimI [Candidatus Bathyarchaeota archaeon]MDP6048823.1 N-acetyltransferase [Candidatus Bathyarchaeota archaeon]MDP7207949.1 N-acetyltransferase [Candidatus Bathyarchaeota archaeon]MDP7443711.1 N-acetyltransferase [Candidatus Bathyarchaeota archaeon]
MESDNFMLRGFRPNDLNRVMDINVECLPENYSKFFYRDLYRRFPETFIVAEADGQIQGYIMCRIERGLSKFKSLRPARLCHVVSIAVREPYRRQGIAKGIMLVAMEKGQETYEASECYLEVRISNGPALVLYEKLGFTKIKRNYSYYMNGEDAWMMAIRIQIPA